jgi:chromosome segregation ATPase
MSDVKSSAEAASGEDAPDLAETSVHLEKSGVKKANTGLAWVIVCLLAVLVFILWRANNSLNLPTHDPQIAALQREIDAHRAALNGESTATDESVGEPVEAIAGRLKRDVDGLLSLAAHFQEELAEKDALIASRTTQISELEALRQTLAKDVVRLQEELQVALAGVTASDAMRGELDVAKAELGLMREEFKRQSGAVSAEDFEDLKRRFEETSRAKEFFEARVAELEKSVK